MALMSAAIGLDGALQRGEGSVSAARLGEGQYEIEFGRDVTGCVYVASASIFQPTALITQARVGKPNWVYVGVFSPNGTPFDAGFSLLVFCGR
ncbi:hypothetical protein ACFSCV_11655 [Methylopila henanensis]|uniref:Uncharacterized protein n=1 Tax=Methylopila henanensis TaxID=873516 RepID=A0ABW4K9B7_9HYPH